MPSDDDPRREGRVAFGKNLRAVREHRDMGQRELAARMAGRGFPWHQNTVTRAEAGDRVVAFYEAVALAAILGVTTDRFTWTAPETAERELAAAASARLRGAWRELALAKARLDDARDAAARTAGRGAKSEFPRVRDATRGISEDIEDCSLELALAEADRIREREREGGGG